MRTLSVAGDRVTILLEGSDTGGAYTVIETLTPPGAGPPPHLHHREEERFLLISGELTFHLGGEARVLKAGDTIIGPRGIAHHFVNTGASDAIFVVVIVPAGIEHFFDGAGMPLPGREARPIPFTPGDGPRLLAAAKVHGIEILI